VAELTDNRRKQIGQSKAASTTDEYLLPKSPDFSLFSQKLQHDLIRKKGREEFVLIRKGMRLLLNA
jgi:hypothetical protein